MESRALEAFEDIRDEEMECGLGLWWHGSNARIDIKRVKGLALYLKFRTCGKQKSWTE